MSQVDPIDMPPDELDKHAVNLAAMAHLKRTGKPGRKADFLVAQVVDIEEIAP